MFSQKRSPIVVTIYEKEALFESLDDTFAEIKAYVVEAINRAELHEVEQHLFRQMQRLGRGFLEAFVARSGTGYEAGNPPLSEEGDKMKYKGTEAEGSPYMSIFGEIRIYRATYAHPAGGRVYPIDAQLNLPAHKYSYLLLKWLQASSAEQDFRSAVDRFNEIFDFSFFPDLPQRQGLSIAEYVEPFYEQVEAPPPQSEGSHMAISADCKGVRILKSEREEPKEEPPAPPRRGKGEKPGLKKDAVVVTDFSFTPHPREGEEIVKGLLSQFTQEEQEEQKQDRKRRREEGLPAPRAPHNKHVFATLHGKKAAFDHMLDHVHTRDPQGQKPLIGLLDGDPYLEDRLLEEVEARQMEDRLDALILDIIHASEYLWEVGTALYGERGPERIGWIEEKLYALLEGNVGYVIGGLRQRQTKNPERLTPPQKKALSKTITYFDNHKHMMHYDVYLKKGYPISTGLVEGTCGSLVKDRMEQSGMRWSIHGAEAVLAQRAVVKNGDWNDFVDFFIDAERDRLYPIVYERVVPYQKVA
ncbi:MAG: ISKra4 family transposase [Nitrospinaceae bacterium]|nr:ISKra4 family transposase [Nitrospinaceae bacterium]